MTRPRDQRWRDGNSRWRTPQQGYFNPDGWNVVDIDEATARNFVEQHHYLRSWPAAKYRFAVQNQTTGHIGGVIVHGIPVSTKTLTNAYPDLIPFEESIELSRLVLLDDLAFNAESWAVARAHRILRERGIKAVVTFSDPMPRTTSSGHTVTPGHRGTVYQALNAIPAGTSTPRTLTLLPDGRVLNDRSRQKLLAGESGSNGVYQTLCQLGAPPLQPGQDPRDWLPKALTTIGATRVRHPGNHRYLMPLGNAKDKARIRVGLPR